MLLLTEANDEPILLASGVSNEYPGREAYNAERERVKLKLRGSVYDRNITVHADALIDHISSHLHVHQV